MNSVVSRLRRGDTVDPESPRHQQRYQATMGLLASFGAVPTVLHDAQCQDVILRHGWLQEDCNGVSEYGTNKPCRSFVWPSWVTDEIIRDAYHLVCEMTRARGQYNQAVAAEARATIKASA